MLFYEFFAVDRGGALLPRATAAVYVTGTTTKAALYDINGASTGNPVTGDLNGLIGFATPDGTYDVQPVSADGSYTAPLMKRVQIVDLLGIKGSITSGRLAYPTYAALAANVSAAAGQIAEVPLSDVGTHTDPVVGGTVNNTGIFRWSASPAGWQRLYDTDAASAKPFSDAAAASATGALASKNAADTDAANALSYAGSALAAYNAAAALTFTFTSASGGTATTVGILQSISSPANGQTAYLAQAGREGWFIFSTATHTTDVTNDPAGAIYIPPSGGTGSTGAWVRIHRPGELCISWFGTAGDGATDDTTAVQRSLNYLCLIMKSGELVVPDGQYLVSNISFPRYDDTSGNALRSVSIRGISKPATQFGTIGTFPIPTTGAIFKSAATTGGALISVAPSGGFGTFSWYRIHLENLCFRLYDNPQIHAVDMGLASQLSWESLQIDTGVYPVQASRPTHVGITGLTTPLNNNAALTTGRDLNVSGFYYDAQINEHTEATGINVLAYIYGLVLNPANHAIRLGRVLAARGSTAVATGGSSGEVAFSIDQLDIEHSITAAQATNPADLTVGNGYQVPVEDFRDFANIGKGFVNWHVVQGGVGPDNTFTITNAQHVQFRQLGEAIPAIATFLQASNPQSIPNATGTLTPIALSTYGSPEVGIALNGSDNTQIIVSRGGTYRIKADFVYASNATGYRRLQITVNGTPVGTDPRNAVNGTATFMKIDKDVSIPAGGIVKVITDQNSGGALNLVSGSDGGTIVLEKLRDQQL